MQAKIYNHSLKGLILKNRSRLGIRQVSRDHRSCNLTPLYNDLGRSGMYSPDATSILTTI